MRDAAALVVKQTEFRVAGGKDQAEKLPAIIGAGSEVKRSIGFTSSKCWTIAGGGARGIGYSAAGTRTVNGVSRNVKAHDWLTFASTIVQRHS